jgi:hypothetical protein
MIYAVANNKVNRSIFKDNEDALTSSIFERLMYLPKELLQHVLQNAFCERIPDLDLSKTTSIEYWPGWNSNETTNKNRVVPDIFIRTAEQDLIIEAKRYDAKQQRKDQWVKEIQAYHNEYGEENKKLIFIALGGLYSIDTETVKVQGKDFIINKCRWDGILQSVKDTKYAIASSCPLINTSDAISNILDDIILCFSLFGFSTADWFEHFIQPANLNDNGIKFLSQSWKK